MSMNDMPCVEMSESVRELRRSLGRNELKMIGEDYSKGGESAHQWGGM